MRFFKAVAKYGRADQATDDSILWRLCFRADQATDGRKCFAYFITEAADTHSEYLVLLTTVF
jgi:hypothetical protein